MAEMLILSACFHASVCGKMGDDSRNRDLRYYNQERVGKRISGARSI